MYMRDKPLHEGSNPARTGVICAVHPRARRDFRPTLTLPVSSTIEGSSGKTNFAPC